MSSTVAREEETIACRMTAAGRGAIAVILVRGPLARSAIFACFRPLRSGAQLAPGEVVLGDWTGPRPRAASESLARTPEKLIVGAVDELSFEVNCHGGRAATDLILADLAQCGARILDPAHLQPQQHSHRLEAACEAVLLRTSTRRTAAIALDQMRGSLRRAIQQIRAAVVAADRAQSLQSTESLLRHAGTGLHLAEPWQVAIAGRPNVGKSSLMNALLGYQRAITADAPGTTRDRLTAETSIEGWPVQLVDMAGVRTGSDAIEQQGVAIAGRAIADADLVLALHSADVPGIEELAGAKQQLRVWTKSDLAPPRQDYDLAISAKTGAGVTELWRQIVSRLVATPPQPGDAVPLAHEQITRLQATAASLRSGNLDDARRQLDLLLD